MPNLSTLEYASKDYSNSLVHLLSLLIIVIPWGAGAFSRDFTKNLAPQVAGWGFYLGFKNRKVKSPTIPRP